MADTLDFLAGKHCLVLDDEFLIALDIQQILEAAGAASVVSVSTAQAAIAAVAERAIDLAVLDVRLTGSGGGGLAVANSLLRKGIAFVFLTGMRSDDEHTRAFPGIPVVEKPYLAPLLLDALRQALVPPPHR